MFPENVVQVDFLVVVKINLNTNDKGVFLSCKQKSHCFGTALSLSAGQMAHEFEQDAT